MPADPPVTLRSVAIGLVVGVLGAVSNTYVSLKLGWSLPMMAIAGMLGVGFAGARGTSLAPSEVVVLTSLASAASYMTGGGNLAAIPALELLGGTGPSTLMMIAWFATLAIFGTAIGPLLGERVRTLEFPTASATASIVEAKQRSSSRTLWMTAGGTTALAIVRRLARVPSTLRAPGAAGTYTFGIETNVLLVGIGALMSPKTAWSAGLGGVVTYAFVAPRLVAAGVVAAPAHRAIVGYMVWAAASLLVASAILELFLDVPKLIAARKGASSAPGARMRWLVVLPAFATALLAHGIFGLSWPCAIGSLLLSFPIAYVAARSMGETDIVPTKALATLAQGTFFLAEGGLVAPTIAPNVSGTAAIHASDSLASLKLAGRLGAPPRLVIGARVVGCLLGAVVVALAYRALVPDARALPTADLPAPAVLVWLSVSDALAKGGIPPSAQVAASVGATIGLALTILARVSPPSIRRWIPSAMGLGSGMVLPASSALSLVLGALLRRLGDPRWGLERTAALAAGVIAGESLAGVAVQMLGRGMP